jgi:hypothetical protein
MVLATLRAHARARQRFWLGLPLLVLGSAGAALAWRGRVSPHSSGEPHATQPRPT